MVSVMVSNATKLVVGVNTIVVIRVEFAYCIGQKLTKYLCFGVVWLPFLSAPIVQLRRHFREN